MTTLAPETKLSISIGLAWTVGLAILSGVAFSAYHTISIKERIEGVDMRLEDFKTSFKGAFSVNQADIKALEQVSREHGEQIIRLKLLGRR